VRKYGRCPRVPAAFCAWQHFPNCLPVLYLSAIRALPAATHGGGQGSRQA
jgi:hypothetical protein